MKRSVKDEEEEEEEEEEAQADAAAAAVAASSSSSSSLSSLPSLADRSHGRSSRSTMRLILQHCCFYDDAYNCHRVEEPAGGINVPKPRKP